MDYQALAKRIAERLGHDLENGIYGDLVSIEDLAAALAAENVTVRNTNGVPVTVYVGVGRYADGTACCVAKAVDSCIDENTAICTAFAPDDTNRCKATIYVPPVVVPEVEGEVSG